MPYYKMVDKISIGMVNFHDLSIVFLLIAASCCSLRSPDTETSQALDMAVCHHPSNMLYLDDHVTDSWVISELAQLDVYHYSQYFFLSGHVLLGCFLPCFLKGAAATQTTFEVHLHQRDCFLQLLAGRVSNYLFPPNQEIKLIHADS